MIYELFIEGQQADINEAISTQITKAIDDVNEFGSRNTSFSKSIVLPATGNNNQLFGHYNEISQANTHNTSATNIGANFNVAKVSRAELKANGLLIIKGFFRITKMIKNGEFFEYEGNLFGELGTFVSSLGNDRLQDLDFSSYDHTYAVSGITGSWDSSGSGYYYPLGDYGTYSTDKVGYDYHTFRPALFVKEYIDKIFTNAGYTYESTFFNEDFFKRLVIPHNQQRLTALSTTQLNAPPQLKTYNSAASQFDLNFTGTTLGDFTLTVGDSLFTYTGSSSLVANIRFSVTGNWKQGNPASIICQKNGVDIGSAFIGTGAAFNFFSASIQVDDVTFNNGDTLKFIVDQGTSATYELVTIGNANFKIETAQALNVPLNLGDTVRMNDTIPRGIFQKDFFVWVLRMFNLYVDEDKLIDKKLIIKPYIDYYDLTTQVDWTYKLAHDKPVEITPMGQLNGRLFECKYKNDNDYYNEQYQKKFQQSYGDRQFDTGFNFAKDKQTVEIGFSPAVLVQYAGTDKVVSVYYKKSKGNSVDQEELTETNIRILLTKKITGVSSWSIKNGATALTTITNYGYAGHLDDPLDPTKDINFGAPGEIYFEPNAYTSNNLFNEYWSDYIAEIADKDSKLIKAYFKLSPIDITKLDFSIPVFIDGVRYRLNKVEDYDVMGELTKCELLKIIHNG